jgi:uncharacterized membrane protein YsdA (DUF1294 family)
VFAVGVAALFLAALCVLAGQGVLPVAVPAVYLAMSAAAVIAYAMDKSAAQRGRWRTSEKSLHALAVMGGWPGALVARHVFRHKSRKASFRTAFWATVTLNCIVLAWVLWATRP